MRFSTVIPLLAATALASSDSSSSSSSSESAAAAESAAPEEPTPVGEIWRPKWTESDLGSYTKHCASRATFKAESYTLGDMYPALKEWAPQLKVFYNKQHYPGSWEGKDVHGTGRDLLKMGHEDLPFAVREWLQKTPKQRHFSLHDDSTIFFAPGAMYPILPLFVDEPSSSSASELAECEGVFEDLENYSAEPKDGVVLSTVTHKSVGKNEVEITVDAFLIRQKKEGEESNGKDEL